ncbi:hypothetical protein KL938_001276 [Ogataea parapolymorpha]|nr:hypothetical protein KL938_001276 [Ogataea parapolymorpha]
MSNELALVEKVELRLALADTDVKFESALNLYLAPILLKFSSSDVAVRTQINKIVKYLLTRINTSNVKLPIRNLINQVKSPNVAAGVDPTVVQSYTLLFISKGLPRLPEKERLDLIPLIIDGISAMKDVIASRMFNVLCKLLLDWHADDSQKGAYLSSWNVNESDQTFLINKFSEFMLMGPVLPDESHNIPQNLTFPGLSSSSISFFTYQAGATFDLGTLTNYKKAIFRFSEAIFQNSATIIAIIASADTSTSLANDATSFLKRIQVNYESKSLVDQLIDLFIGDSERPPASLYLQEKIMNFCSQSHLAAFSPKAAQLCSLGLESDYPRLKQSTIKFIKWLSTAMLKNETRHDETLCKTIAIQLRNNLAKEDATNTTQRRFQYEALAVVFRRLKVPEDCTFVNFLFKMMEHESADLRSSIQDAIYALAPLLPQLPSDEKQKLMDLLESYIKEMPTFETKDNILSCRYAAVKLVNACFPFSDTRARIVNVLAQTQFDKPETLEEASKGLHPYYFSLIQNIKSSESKVTVEFPDFESLVQEAHHIDHANIGKLMTFAWRCLVMQAIRGCVTVIVPDQQWEIRLENALEYDEKVKSLIVKELKRLEDKPLQLDPRLSVLSVFLKMQLEVFISESGLEAGRQLYQILISSPRQALCSTIFSIDRLKAILTVSLSDDVLLYASKCLAIIASQDTLEEENLKSLLTSLLSDDQIMATSFLISQLVLRGKQRLVSTELFDEVLMKIENYINSPSSRFHREGLESLSQLASYGCLGPVLTLSSKVNSYKSKFVELLLPLVKKLNEKAAIAISCVSLSLPISDTEYLPLIESALYGTHNSKQTEFYFTAGEAFSILAAGVQSKVVANKLDIRDESLSPPLEHDDSRLPIILDTIIEACANTKPALKRAGCIWLLSLVQHCGHLEHLQNNLGLLQRSFLRFLTDKDEIIQESATRGLSMVYEMGDAELKDTLTHDLLSSFTDSRKSATSGYLHEETELFDPGVMNTGDSSVSTYKDVLNLASEVGDPSLVYKFMSIAKSSALWSSRKGIAFGLGAILDKSKLETLISNDQKLASRLIPKLFRYRFDPSPSVAQTMNDIWSSLLPNSKVITDNFETILSDLLTNMGSREWRVRQASAAAIQDLLRHVSFEEYETHLEKIWTMAFRVMDDIKESVRVEGNSLTRYLATTMVNKISSTDHQTSNDSKILSQLVPFLLGSNGLLNDSDDVKNFALQIIIKLARSSSILLKPYICDMVGQLTMMMSSIEPQVVNYLALNADKYNMKSDDIDSQRLAALGSSPIMEAIEQLMNLLDENLMTDFIVHLSDAVKKSVGLPSKVTGSKIIITLITRHYIISQTHGDDFLKICMSQLKDRNETVSKSYAISAGYCVRIASLKKIDSLAKKLKAYYFEAGDNEKLKLLSASASESISKYSGDKFQSIAVSFLPLIFVGKHDPVKEVSDLFTTAWEDSSSGGSGPIKLYLKEIIELIMSHINSTDLQIRQSIALSIIEIVDKLGPEIGSLGNYLGQLYEILIVSLRGRSYKGKENLLRSLVLLATKTPNYLYETENIQTFDQVKRCILVEARRKNKEYAIHSVQSLGIFLGTFPDEEMYEEYLGLIDSFIQPKPKNESDMDTDSEDDATKSNKKAKDARLEEMKIQLLENQSSALNLVEPNRNLCEHIMKNLVEYFDDDRYQQTYKTQLAIIKGFAKLLKSFEILDDDLKKQMFDIWITISTNCANRENLQNVLIAFIRATSEFARVCPAVSESCKKKLEEMASLEINSVVNMEISNALNK